MSRPVPNPRSPSSRTRLPSGSCPRADARQGYCRGRGWRLALALIVALVSACDRPPRAGDRRVNLVLVTIDTLRADHLGAYGAADAQTPTLDALAHAGVRFATCIASAPLTLPSHASILTGLYPPHHGVRHNGLHRLGPEVETLAERLRGAGYRTAAVVGSYVLSRRFGLAQGFEFYDDRMEAHRAGAAGYLERRAANVTDRALAWLEEARPPFFLWVHYYDPHAAYQPPPPFASRFTARPYDGEIAYVDRELGRLLEGLRARGLAERSLVVVTADHGESLGEHQEPTHSYTLYDATLAVPLLLRGPGVPRGKVVQDLARGVDVVPTVLALLGMKAPQDLDGRDLAASWRHPQDSTGGSPPVAYAETLATELDHGWSPLFAIRTPHWLYVRAPRPELYDVVRDPYELHDQAPAASAALRQVMARLDAEIDRVRRSERAPTALRLDAATRRRLQALGYAAGEAPARATGLDPKDGLPWLGRYDEALAAFERRDLRHAREELEAVLKALPASRAAHALLARVLLASGLPRAALAHAERAVQLSARSAEAWVLLGDARLHRGDESGAAEAYRRAAECDPDEPLAQVGLAWAEGRAGRFASAREHAARAIELDPSSPELRERLGEMWEKLGRYQEALAAYRAASELAPDSGRFHMELAIQLARLGRDREAARERTAAGPAGKDPGLLNRLAIVYAARGESARAERLFRELVATHPHYPTARRNLAHLLRMSGRTAEALQMEREASRAAAAPAP